MLVSKNCGLVLAGPPPQPFETDFNETSLGFNTDGVGVGAALSESAACEGPCAAAAP